MRKYKLRNYKGVAGAAYGNFPAVNFNMQPQEFEKYINELFFFTKDEKEEAKKIPLCLFMNALLAVKINICEIPKVEAETFIP